MNKLLAALVLGLFVFWFAPSAQAHVVQLDDSGRVGALLHVTPDDDPIAGELSNIYIDLQPVPAGELTATLRITDSESATEVVAAEVAGGSVRAEYTFPARGVYTLQFQIVSPVDTFAISFTQRVARGVGSLAEVRQHHAWAEAALFGVGAATLVLVALLCRNWPEILRHIRQNTL